jgi:hypothetical protein
MAVTTRVFKQVHAIHNHLPGFSAAPAHIPSKTGTGCGFSLNAFTRINIHGESTMHRVCEKRALAASSEESDVC